MSRNIIIKRPFTSDKKKNKIIYMNVDGKKNYNLMPNLTVTIPADNGPHRFVFSHMSLLKGELKEYVVPAGAEDVEIWVSIDEDKNLLVRMVGNLGGTKPSGGSAGSGAGETPNEDALPGGLSKVKLGNKLKQLLDPAGGKLYKALVDEDAGSGSVLSTSMRVEMSENAIHFYLHAGMSMKLVHSILYSAIRTVSGPGIMDKTIELKQISAQNGVMQFIFKYVNSNACPAVRMTGDYIVREEGFVGGYVKPVKPEEPVKPVKTVEPEIPVKKEEQQVTEPAAEKPEHPDMYDSMTSHGIWLALHESFGEGSSFEQMVKQVPATCLVTAERESLIVTVMLEKEEHVNMAGNGGTTVFEYNYSKCTNKGFQQALESGKTVTHEDMLHNFDVLENEEDRAELVDYLMYFIDTIPHVIVEGNSFRSRRPGEEIIDIEHSLTAKVMSHKVLQLFGLEGEAMDILRRSNIAYCLICSYKDYIKLIYVDMDDETIHTVRYDFTDLVSEDFLAGEGCFSRLTCNYEKDSLDEYLGRAVCELPYFTPCMTSEGEMYCQVYLNKTIVPGLDEPFVPASGPEPEPAKSGEPDEPLIPDIPESPAEETKHPDMYESLTARGLARQIEESFGENTPFAYMAQQIPVTCYVTADETSVGITMMVEDEEKAKAMGGYTKSYALLYSQAAMKGMQAKMEAGAVLTPESFLNDFESLDCEEDRNALLNYLMQTIAAFPHVVAEGNSFRSRQDDEVLVDVEHSLTAKVMGQKVIKLFSMDSKAVDILRRKNVMFCQIAAYRDFVKLIYADADFEALDSDCYEYSDLVDADFLTGEGCFDHLESENEQIRLGKYLGEKVCQLPHIMAMADESQVYYDMVLLNEELVPGLDEPFVPAEPEEPAEAKMPDGPLYMDGPVDGPEGDMPEEPDEPVIAGAMPLPDGEDFDGPVFSVQSSPTTWAMVQYLNMQFGQGGGLARFMKDSGFDKVTLRALSDELVIGFCKGHVGCTSMNLKYIQFNKGSFGEFEDLAAEIELEELQNIIRMSVPVFSL